MKSGLGIPQIRILNNVLSIAQTEGFPPSQKIALHVSSSCRAYMVQRVDKGSGEALTATGLLLYIVSFCRIPELLGGMREVEEK